MKKDRGNEKRETERERQSERQRETEYVDEKVK